MIGSLIGVGGFGLATRVAAVIGVMAILTAWLVLPRPAPATHVTTVTVAPEAA